MSTKNLNSVQFFLIVWLLFMIANLQNIRNLTDTSIRGRNRYTTEVNGDENRTLYNLTMIKPVTHEEIEEVHSKTAKSLRRITRLQNQLNTVKNENKDLYRKIESMNHTLQEFIQSQMSAHLRASKEKILVGQSKIFLKAPKLHQSSKLYNADGTPVIDAVFTYVNGSDPVIIERNSRYGVIAHDRVRDIGQLRYAMRSAYLHAPFIRNFIVVISGPKESQIPSWLNVSHPKVRIVQHEEIWDDVENLPSMNSHAIEWATMNIPGLSEVYLYFNDDFSIQENLKISSIWGGPDRHILHEAWEAPGSENQVSDTYGKSLAYIRKLYDAKYGRFSSRKVASHVPMLMNRTIMKLIKNDFPSVFEDMYRKKPFRTNHDVQFQFAYQQYIRHHYKFTVAKDSNVHFHSLTSDYSSNQNIFRQVLSRPRQFLCLQDSFSRGKVSENVLDGIHKFYERLYNARAPWEKW